MVAETPLMHDNTAFVTKIEAHVTQIRRTHSMNEPIPASARSLEGFNCNDFAPKSRFMDTKTPLLCNTAISMKAITNTTTPSMIERTV